MDDDKSKKQKREQPYTREDIEQSHAEEADAKLDKLVGMSPRTRQDREIDDDGTKRTHSVLDIVPPTEGNSLLKNYGYSLVRIGRTVNVAQDGSAVYPWATIIETYDTEGLLKDFFVLMRVAEKMRLAVGDETAGSLPTGIDRTTGETTHDTERFDSTQASDMLPAKLRRLEGNEFANLISIIIACETDDR